MAKIERSARAFLSDWKLWMGIAYFAIVAILIWQVRLSSRQAQEEANRAATAKAAAATQVGQCFTSVKNAPVVNGFIRSHEAIIENGLISNRASIAASPGDPLNQIRRKAIKRLMAAKANADELKALISSTAQSRKSCLELAAQLHVDASRYTRTPK